jgi:L-amino acid N-acyltransferase YncA
MSQHLNVRNATAADAPDICAIYNHYVEHTPITFEEEPVAAEAMARRIEAVQCQFPWLVVTEGPGILGYAYAGKWRERSAYRYSAETTIYLRPEVTGKGIGSILYQELMMQLRQRRLHALFGGIALPNASSVALHEKLGFRQCGHLREVGRKFDRWIDVGYWQLLL